MENKQQCLKNFIPMRVALVLGSLLNVSGIVLSLMVDMKFIVISIVVSIGLLISGLFGWCPMVYILTKVLPFRKDESSLS